MRVNVSSRELERSGHLGPLCLACGNKQRFWMETRDGVVVSDLTDVSDGEVRIVACGRCRSRHSLVMARID